MARAKEGTVVRMQNHKAFKNGTTARVESLQGTNHIIVFTGSAFVRLHLSQYEVIIP